MSDAAAQAQASSATATQEAASPESELLSKMLDLQRPIDTTARERSKSYLEEFVRQAVKPGQVVSKDVEASIQYWIKEIDRKLSAQMNEIMHDAAFQKLESSWRGLHYLVHQSETGEFLKIRVWNVTKKELSKDLEKAAEFDQSILFKQIYEENYGTYGGEPFGLLVGDYEFDHSSMDVKLLQKISGVAAAAHAPFVAAAAPRLFGMDSFTQLPNPRDLAKIFQSVDYAVWKSFRDSEDSRYVALTLPHVLGRLPYGEKFQPVEEFNFEEQVDGKEHNQYLWMNAAWAYGARITDAFAKDGWFGRIRGPDGGGKVLGLPVHTFPTDDGDLAMKCPTEIAITDRREAELSDLGFLGLLHCKNTDYAAFFGAQSCQKPKKYFDPDANANAELSTKFNFLLCVARFSHYLKVMARNKIGSYMEAKDCEKWLNSWIMNYVIANPEDANEEQKAKSPLAAAQIKVEEVAGRPGWYEAVAWLRPHFQLEGLRTSFRLVARVPQKK
jgi:type VI secretion system protein ImpC